MLSRPSKKSTPDVWAAENRVYPSHADRPGPRDPTLTPYMIPFVRGFDDPRYQTIALACGAQMAKTEAELDVIGQRFDQRPTPTIYVGPSKDFLRDEIEPRLMAMIEQAPTLTDKLARGKRNRQFRKVVGGVPLRLIWAGSATQLAGTSAGLVLIDEIDRMKKDVGGEGNPLMLAKARGFTFRDRKYGVTSTPLEGAVDIEKCETSGLYFWKRMPAEDIQSPIWQLFQTGTMFHWAWPCPHCADFFIPRFRNLKWPEDSSPARARREAYVECPRCGGVIENEHKAEMNARGVYVAPGQNVNRDGTVTGEPPDATVLSFWVSGLCSPFVSFGERAAEFLEAKESGDQQQLQSVINTGFGELWAPGGGDVPEWAEVAARKHSYRRGELPPGARLITMTVDVQRKRLIYVVRGWGVRGTSWLVDHGELTGDTAEPEVWEDLATLISEPIAGKRLRMVLVDSGFRPGKPINVPVNRVYAFARRFPRLVRITKGRDTQAKPVISSAIEVKEDGSLKKYGLELLWLDTDYCKSWVHERIRWPSGQPGAWYLPGDITEDYCKQIVAEARVRKPSGRPQWVQRARENHYLDCEAMQAAAAHLLNVHLIRGPDQDGPSPSDAPLSSEQPVPIPQAPVQVPPRAMPHDRVSAALRAAAIARFYR